MSGASPLNREQVKAILKATKNNRDNALLSVGFCTGYRISELLRIKIKDVATVINGYVKIHDSVNVRKTKNGSGRAVRLNSTARQAIERQVKTLLNDGHNVDCALFGRAALPTQAITRQYAHKLIKILAEKANIFLAKISTHSLRKTYAQAMWILLNKDISKLQFALGHKSVNSTISYISFLINDIDDAIDQLAF